MSHPFTMTRIALIAVLGAGLMACSDRNDKGREPAPPRTDLGDTFVVTSANRVLSYGLQAPGAPRTAVAITGLATGEKILDADGRPSTLATGGPSLYALGSTGQIYTLDPVSGAATAVAAVAPLTLDPEVKYSIDFNPLVDLLRLVGSDGDNRRINLGTGAVTDDGNLKLDGDDKEGITDVAYSNSFPDGCTTVIYYLDSATDTLYTTATPNTPVLTAVGALGVDATASHGFDLVGSSGNALALLTVGSTPGLYFVDVTTGAATLRSPIAGLNAGETIVGAVGNLSDAVKPAGNMLALTTEETQRLVTFNRANVARTCTSADVALFDADGEDVTGVSLVGIDLRQADGLIYGLGDDGSVFQLDASTGEGFMVVAGLVRNDGAGNPVEVALDEGPFGVDFNPSANRLRIVSASGQNLRVNLEPTDNVDTTGVDESQFNTTVDGPIAAGGVTVSGVTGVGYTNADPADAPPASTAIYYIDANTDQLMTTTSPNEPNITVVGALGTDTGTVNGFDIAGADNTGYLVSNAAAATASSLYSVNLTTGAATLVGGGIGSGSPGTVPGLLSGLVVLTP